ncbi:hypothetical protein CCP3SC5AM1_2890005 [Gammaproteobacteria bacterium]
MKTIGLEKIPNLTIEQALHDWTTGADSLIVMVRPNNQIEILQQIIGDKAVFSYPNGACLKRPASPQTVLEQVSYPLYYFDTFSELMEAVATNNWRWE